MNNRGQSLIAFVLIIPIIIFLIFMVYDIGRMVLLKEELDNINYLTIDYGLEQIESDNLELKLHDMLIKKKKN